MICLYTVHLVTWLTLHSKTCSCQSTKNPKPDVVCASTIWSSALHIHQSIPHGLFNPPVPRECPHPMPTWKSWTLRRPEARTSKPLNRTALFRLIQSDNALGWFPSRWTSGQPRTQTTKAATARTEEQLLEHCVFSRCTSHGLFNPLLPRFSLVGVHQSIWPIWPAHPPELDFGMHLALQSA